LARYPNTVAEIDRFRRQQLTSVDDGKTAEGGEVVAAEDPSAA